MDPILTDIHTHHPDPAARCVLSVSLRGPGQPMPSCGTAFSAGIHPWDIAVIEKSDIDLFYNELMANTSLIAIGETGLDYARDIDREAQLCCFERQLGIARKKELPVVLHCVRAFEPVMEILSRYRLPAVIFHGFTGSREQALRAVRAGYYLSFSDRSFRSPKTLEAMRATPLENMFFETDDSGLPVAEIYAKASLELGISVIELASVTERNYKKIFG